MKKLTILFLVVLGLQMVTGQHPAENLIPPSAATHTVVSSGDWSDTSIWNTQSIPGEGAIVHIPQNFSVTYSQEDDIPLFGIRVDGQFMVSQSNSSLVTRLKFDTFYSSPSSFVSFNASQPDDGQIEISITPFDILTHESTVTSGDNAWNASAAAHYTDGLPVNSITREIVLPRRFNTYAEATAAYAGQSPFEITSNTPYDDGTGVTGRYDWDPMQMSIGMVIRGEIEILGKEKTTYVQLSQDAERLQNRVVLKEAPDNWNIGDQIVITKGGKLDATQNATEVFELAGYDGPTTLVALNNLTKNHEGTPDPDFTLHCYVGNLTRNIVFKSDGDITNIHRRGHFMIMGANENVQIRNAQFKNMGRTDKSRWNDDLLFNEWVETDIIKSKYSPLGQNVANSYRPAPQDITNHRGRYSIHLHKNGSTPLDNLVQVTGNVVWGNPGWGITHHDAYANVSDNVVYDVLGAGIVAESGSETGFWNNNLVVKIEKRPGNGADTDPYLGALFYNDLLFSGAGLGMKGRAVVCNDNVIADVVRGISIINMNPNMGATDRVDPLQLATVRPGLEIDQFPLSKNGYSAEGDGVMPVEVALIMNNSTVIASNLGFRSIERDMGLNHESRSVFDGLILWGTKQGITNTYQADYTFHDVFISGDKTTNASPTEGLYMWKHSHNHVYDNIKFRDLDNAVVPSKLVLSDNGEYKTRNNGYTPWIFIDAKVQNVGKFYEIIDEDNNVNPLYTEHADNPIFLNQGDVNMERQTTFTLLDEASTGQPYFEIPGDVQYPFAQIDYTEPDPEKQFAFAIDGVITDKLGAYKYGVEQAAAQGSLRNGYPERLYKFASEAKFIEYLNANGVYENPEDGSLYFIINELVPDRLTSEYTSFPLRIKILNPPSNGVFATPLVEENFGCEAKNQLISRLASVTQSSTQGGITVAFNGENLPVDPYAAKAIDGNNNARDNAQFLQRFETTGVPVGTYAQTEVENQPWFDLDFGEEATLSYIDLWNTVILNGADIAPTNDDLSDFYILLDDEPFTGKTLDQAIADAEWSHHQTQAVGRKLSIDNAVAGVKSRYMRIQKTDANTSLKIAEIEVLGSFKTDFIPPTVQTQDITISLDETGNAVITANQVDNGSTDNCAIDTFALDQDTFDCTMVGANQVTLLVTDVNGNQASSTATVTVEDTTPPTVLSQDLNVNLDDTGSITIVAEQIDNGSTDACGIQNLSINQNTFDCSMIGTNEVLLSVTDVNGNVSTAVALVTVVDATAPEVLTQDITVSLDDEGSAIITAQQVDNGSTDACNIDTLSLNQDTFDCSMVGENQVVLTVTDVNGNTSSANAIVTVQDSSAPEIVCEEDLFVSIEEDMYVVPDYWSNDTTQALDNCTDPIMLLTQSPVPGTQLPLGEHIITLTAQDEFENSNSCTFTLTIDASLGVDDPLLNSSETTIYPNPTSAVITLEADNRNINRIETYDALGRGVKVPVIRGMATTQTLDLGQFPNGMYFLIILYENGQKTVHRLVKK